MAHSLHWQSAMKLTPSIALISCLAATGCLQPAEPGLNGSISEAPFKSGDGFYQGLSAEEAAAMAADYDDTEVDEAEPVDVTYKNAKPTLDEVYVFTTPDRWANRDATPLLVEFFIPFLWPSFALKAIWWGPGEIIDLFKRLDEASWEFTAADLGTTKLELRGTLEGVTTTGNKGKTRLQLCERKHAGDAWSCDKLPSIKRGERYYVDYSSGFNELIPGKIWGYRRVWKVDLKEDRQYLVKLRYRLECNADAYIWNGMDNAKDCMSLAPAVTFSFAAR